MFAIKSKTQILLCLRMVSSRTYSILKLDNHSFAEKYSLNENIAQCPPAPHPNRDKKKQSHLGNIRTIVQSLYEIRTQKNTSSCPCSEQGFRIFGEQTLTCKSLTPRGFAFIPKLSLFFLHEIFVKGIIQTLESSEKVSQSYLPIYVRFQYM